MLPKEGNLLGSKVLVFILQAGFDRSGVLPIALPSASVNILLRR